MQVRRMLMVVAACVLTSLALVTTAAQAMPSSSTGSTGSTHVRPSKFPKIKGDAFYYFCGTLAGCPAPYYFVVNGKAKSWEFYEDPGVGGFTVKYKKDPYSYFYYADGYGEGCVLVGLKVKGGYVEGGWYCLDEEGEYVLLETWEAFK
jgi:hypothetical protein